MSPRTRVCLLAALCFSAAGCAKPQLVSAPGVKNPVLLSRVDRVGGHVPDKPALIVGSVDTEALVLNSVSWDENGAATQRSSMVSKDDKISKAVQAAAHDDANVDVHIDRLEAGAYLFLLSGTATSNRWVGVQARAYRKEFK